MKLYTTKKIALFKQLMIYVYLCICVYIRKKVREYDCKVVFVSYESIRYRRR